MKSHKHQKNSNGIKKFHICLWVVPLMILLVVTKFFIHRFNLEFVAVSPLFTSTMAGAIFIISILLAGILADFKEAEKFPAEIRATLENILEEATLFHQKNKEFDLKKILITINKIVHLFFKGIDHEGDHHDLDPCLNAINQLASSFSEMEQLGMAPNFLVRLKIEQGVLRKIVLRIYQIQRTQFIPSVHILAESLIGFLTLFLLFLTTEGSPESFILFGFIAYFFLYIGRLIRVLEKPFREGHETMDDVSLFLLREMKS
ncbi:TPA: hypothetical protein ACVNTL_002219 [Legionella pneumophila]|uniref:Bestrophin, RFP-TM, chloride channel n=2 Tax=Legionella erythra TaxID=448 RepID=A0A0W0TJD8_LEGER|nr:hypothetical protein [Legionella erythra]KTC95597.1 hypothetical protein Lery_2156 [Legionella erythra]